MRAKLSAEATRYAPGLKLAQRVLAESHLPNREVVMISDFQRNGWVRDDTLRPAGRHHLHARADHRSAAGQRGGVVGAAAALAVLGAGTHHRGGGHRQPRAGAREQPPRGSRHRRPHARVADDHGAAGHAPASVTFQPFTLARPFTRGTVKISDDKLKPDNAFNFVVSPAQRLPVLILEPPRASREASLYLQRALAIGTAPAFQVDVRQADNVSSADLERHRVVILNDTAALSSGEALKHFVAQGGGLFVVLGEHAVWGTDSNDILPGVPGNIVDRAGPRRLARGAGLQPSRPRALQGAEKRRPDHRAFLPLSRGRDEAAAGRGEERRPAARRARDRAIRRRRGGDGRAEDRIGQRHPLVVDARQLLERPRAEAGLSAVHSSGGPAPRDLRRAAELVHRGPGGRPGAPAAGGRLRAADRNRRDDSHARGTPHRAVRHAHAGAAGSRWASTKCTGGISRAW